MASPDDPQTGPYPYSTDWDIEWVREQLRRREKDERWLNKWKEELLLRRLSYRLTDVGLCRSECEIADAEQLMLRVSSMTGVLSCVLMSMCVNKLSERVLAAALGAP